ncbi:30S ribosomal protein S10 [Anaplasmataceae bacterium AB001_6]|nr:30S ribosomal protein S10 [Anaplasmataceae bacterium AB001_6]
MKNLKLNEHVKSAGIDKYVSYSSRPYISVKIKSNDALGLERIVKRIVATALKEGARVKGPVPLPKRVKIYTVNKSPHVYKKSREQYKWTKHVRLLIIYDFDLKLTEKFTSWNLIPAGLDADIKIQGLDFAGFNNE